jgi:hypothetical protein
MARFLLHPCSVIVPIMVSTHQWQFQMCFIVLCCHLLSQKIIVLCAIIVLIHYRYGYGSLTVVSIVCNCTNLCLKASNNVLDVLDCIRLSFTVLVSYCDWCYWHFNTFLVVMTHCPVCLHLFFVPTSVLSHLVELWPIVFCVCIRSGLIIIISGSLGLGQKSALSGLS